MPDRAGEAEDLFWACAERLYEQPGVAPSTMFGFPCIRVDDQFVAMPARDSLWVKLPADQVNHLIESGVGEICAPGGRPFREWVEIRSLDGPLWVKLLNDSIDFVRP